MGKISLVIVVLAGAALMGCAEGYCRTTKNPVQNVFIFKPDGSLQCGQGKAVAPEKMADELNMVKIISNRKENDGILRTTVCGAPTGQINIYEIPYYQLSKALKLGFKELKK